MAEAHRPPIARPRRRSVARAPLYITGIAVDQLFGKLDYPEITVREESSSSGRVSVIYGDNGTGKTTILRLLYACLSPQISSGLRSLVARTPFKRFTIHLSDGIDVDIVKEELVGDFEVLIGKSAHKDSFNIEVSGDGRVREQDSVTKLEDALQTIGFDILFVDHNRVVQSTYSFLTDLSVSVRDRVPEWTTQQYLRYTAEMAARSGQRLKENDFQFPLPQVVDAVERWFRSQAYRQGAAGEQSAAAVYLEIARALNRGRPRSASSLEVPTRNIIDVLRSLSSVTDSFVRHGLLSAYPFEELINVYESASKSKRSQIEIALNPFLDSIQRRVSALNNVHDILTVFERELDKYFTRKTVKVDIIDGVTISDETGKIALDALSSGEKQLVFLLCSAVISRSSRSLILIDEPELSLNYKWQRLIAESLSAISAASSTQYILASHSIEIITRYVHSSFELAD